MGIEIEHKGTYPGWMYLPQGERRDELMRLDKKGMAEGKYYAEVYPEWMFHPIGSVERKVGYEAWIEEKPEPLVMDTVKLEQPPKITIVEKLSPEEKKDVSIGGFGGVGIFIVALVVAFGVLILGGKK